jgi:GNAT superfamily N-acetyltransferase
MTTTLIEIPRTPALSPRKAAAADLPAVIETLALAFHDDPVFEWWIGDDSRRGELLPSFFEPIAKSYLAYDETYTVDEGVATAVWGPPGAEEDEQLPAVLGEAAEEHAERLFEVFELMEEKHPMEPHYYLFLLGTRPGWQGRGLGSSLMASVLERADRDQMPAYLEATSERNKQLYLRHGFEVIGQIHLPDGPTMWPMWRSPR